MTQILLSMYQIILLSVSFGYDTNVWAVCMTFSWAGWFGWILPGSAAEVNQNKTKNPKHYITGSGDVNCKKKLCTKLGWNSLQVCD